MDFEAYGLVLAIHSTLRWVALGAGVVAAAAAWGARLGSSSWADTTSGAGRAFAITMDLQLVVGLVLYLALSPTVASGLGNMSGAMADSQHRFWMVEHPVAMIVALSWRTSASRRAGTDRARKGAASRPGTSHWPSCSSWRCCRGRSSTTAGR